MLHDCYARNTTQFMNIYFNSGITVRVMKFYRAHSHVLMHGRYNFHEYSTYFMRGDSSFVVRGKQRTARVARYKRAQRVMSNVNKRAIQAKGRRRGRATTISAPIYYQRLAGNHPATAIAEK